MMALLWHKMRKEEWLQGEDEDRQWITQTSV